MDRYMEHLLRAAQPVSTVAAASREFERPRPLEGVGENRVRWREAAILEAARAMMPKRRRPGHA